MIELKVFWAIPEKKIAAKVKGFLPGFDVAVPEVLTAAEIEKHVKDADFLVIRRLPPEVKITKEIIAKSKKLKLIQKIGELLPPDIIDVEAAKKAGISVVVVPILTDKSVAEHAFTFMLSLSRNIINAHKAVVNAEYLRFNLKPEKTSEWHIPGWPVVVDLPASGAQLYGKTLGIVGMGQIGRELARRAASFGMKIIYYDMYRLGREEEKKLGIEYKSFDEVLSQSDFISLHLPHTDKTEKMIGKRELSLMKPTAFLINCARGGLIDPDALYDALKNKRIAGAGLDVSWNEPIDKDDPLLKLNNVILTPHIAYGKHPDVYEEVCKNILRVARGGKIGETQK